MNLSRIVAVLLLVIQLANMGMFLIQAYAPDYAVLVAAVVGGMQAFVNKVQASKSE